MAKSKYGFHVENKCNHDHNNRQISNNPRIDVDRSHLNVELKDLYKGVRYIEPQRKLLVKEVGEYQINGKSVNEYLQEYNDKQKRSDRVITLREYMDKLKSNRDGGLVRIGREHEMIFQIGKAGEELSRSDSLFDLGPDRSDFELQNAVLSDVYRELESSFKDKGLMITQCYVHNDETTPHMHLSFITIQEAQRPTGLQVDFSFDNWCKRNFGSFVGFREHLDQMIIEKAKTHGLELDHNKPNKGKKLHQDKYNEMVDKVNELQVKNDELQFKNEKANQYMNQADKIINSQNEKMEALKNQASKGNQQMQRLVDNVVKRGHESDLIKDVNDARDPNLQKMIDNAKTKYENNNKDRSRDEPFDPFARLK